MRLGQTENPGPEVAFLRSRGREHGIGLGGEERTDPATDSILLEILDDRHGRGSAIVTSQVDVKHWHDMIPNPTVADAILDRLVHNAHRLTLTGESLRKAGAKRAPLDPKTQP